MIDANRGIYYITNSCLYWLRDTIEIRYLGLKDSRLHLMNARKKSSMHNPVQKDHKQEISYIPQHQKLQ